MPYKRDSAFDGRSFRTDVLKYTLRQRIVVLIAMNLMPLLTRLFCSHSLNTAVWRLLGCKVGRHSVIRMGTQINVPFKVVIGSYCSIHGHVKARGGVLIGDGVEFVEDVLVSTQTHSMESSYFESQYRPVHISDYAWLGPRSIVLAGVSIGRGGVLAAGAVATKDLEGWSVYAGIPARKIKERAVLEGRRLS